MQKEKKKMVEQCFGKNIMETVFINLKKKEESLEFIKRISLYFSKENENETKSSDEIMFLFAIRNVLEQEIVKIKNNKALEETLSKKLENQYHFNDLLDKLNKDKNLDQLFFNKNLDFGQKIQRISEKASEIIQNYNKETIFLDHKVNLNNMEVNSPKNEWGKIPFFFNFRGNDDIEVKLQCMKLIKDAIKSEYEESRTKQKQLEEINSFFIECNNLLLKK